MAQTPMQSLGNEDTPSTSRLIQLIEEAGVAVLTMTEGLEKEEFFASRLTRAETRHQLKRMCRSALLLGADLQAQWAEIDWDGWRALEHRLNSDDKAEEPLLWLAICALAPNTLLWLRIYRSSQPEWFYPQQ